MSLFNLEKHMAFSKDNVSDEMKNYLRLMAETCEESQRDLTHLSPEERTEDDKALAALTGGFLYLYYHAILEVHHPRDQFKLIWGAFEAKDKKH